MTMNILKGTLKLIRSITIIGAAIYFSLKHTESFTLDYFYYGFGILGITIICSHYNILKKSKSSFAVMVKYCAIAFLSVPFLLLLFEVMKYFSPYYSLKDIINRVPVFGYIEIALYIGCTISGLLFILKKRGMMYDPIYRISFFYIFHATLIYCIVVRAYWSYHLFFMSDEIARVLQFGAISAQVKTSYQSVIAFAGGYFINKFYKEKQPLFKVPQRVKYALYLRSFKDDIRVPLDRNLGDFYKSKNIEIVQVADPSKLSSNRSFQGKNVFILSPDWKKELSYCIKQAEQVILCLGYSEGVQWEMYSNIQYLDKYLFYVPNQAVLSEHANLTCQNYTDNPVAEAIKGLCMLNYPSFYFVIKDNRCYYSEDFETLINRDGLDGVLYIKLQSRNHITGNQEKTEKKSFLHSFSRISLKHIFLPIIALCPLLSLGIQSGRSLSNSSSHQIFLIICYLLAVIILIKQLNDTEK